MTKEKPSERSLFFQKAAKDSLNYNAGVHSPAISSGISIEHDHFAYVFMSYSRVSIDPATAAQMLCRCRATKSATIVLAGNNRNGVEDPEAVLAGMRGASREAFEPTRFDQFIASQRRARASLYRWPLPPWCGYWNPRVGRLATAMDSTSVSPIG